MKYLLVIVFSLLNINLAVADNVQVSSSEIMSTLSAGGLLDDFSDAQIGELENYLELKLIEQNSDFGLLSTIGGALSSIGGKLSDLLKGAKAGFKTAADLVKKGLGKAVDVANALGIPDVIKEIPATVAELGVEAVIEFIKAMAGAKS